ncbi:MAG: heme ABC exporter ATP-binding protein CcmA [Ardenticatenaceae bacterium]|nr:heme ABC exporter ATP-binding protein CcmA [Ardenticatenaceae bacterium]MCB9005556.1 heme ABC exporter ATP-binding protein CcmA [Ardenticatenaceae bacterium]
MIEIKGLVKNYGLNPVLRGVDLHVRQGEFVTLVGANGAGKSTLMRIVATLLTKTGGSVTIGGWPLPEHAAKVRRHIGLVSHQSLLYGDLTAAENLSFFARLYKLDNREERVLNALKTVGLLARQRDPVSTFSRGMVQRLTIARATLHEPDVLLLDEPYTGLDQDAARLLDGLLTREAGNGRTIFMITHDLVHGLNLCDRVLILNRGKIAADLQSAEIGPNEFLDLYAAHTGRSPQEAKR